MTTYHAPEALKPDVLKTKDMPPLATSGKQINFPLSIAKHLVSILKEHTLDVPAAVTLPTSLDLAEFYGCQVMDVLQGLSELKKTGHDYKLFALDKEITVYDIEHLSNQSARKKYVYHSPQFSC